MEFLRRLDARIGRAYNRAIGWLCLVIGAVIAIATLADNNFTLAGGWPFLAFAALFLILARLSWRSKSSMLETLAETPTRTRR